MTQPELSFISKTKRKLGFHYTPIWRSRQQQRIFQFLRSRIKASGYEIQQQCNVMNPATWISMLNRNLELHGWLDLSPGQAYVDCRYERKSETGAKIYVYYLVCQSLTDQMERQAEEERR